MKKLLYFLFVLAVLIALCGCADTSGQAEEPGMSETPGLSDSIPSSTPQETEPQPTETEEVVYQLVSHILGAELYCESDPYSGGVLTLTDLATGETVSGMNGNSFWSPWDTDELDWENAVAEPGDLFADAKYVIRQANVENGWYAEFHDGVNAHYIYYSSVGLYVPVKQGRTAYEGALDVDIPTDRTAEDVAQEISDAVCNVWQKVTAYDPTFRVENTTVEDVVEKYAQHRAERMALAYAAPFTVDSVQVDSVNEEGTRIEYRADYITTCWWPFAFYMENGDGTYTVTCRETLILDENGLWAYQFALDYVGWGQK